jgi:hypothetical protein
MNQVTAASIAYVATQVRCSRYDRDHSIPYYIVLQVRFALTSSAVFSKSDKSTDSETFYNSILDLFDDLELKHETDELLSWWNRYGSFFGLRWIG